MSSEYRAAVIDSFVSEKAEKRPSRLRRALLAGTLGAVAFLGASSNIAQAGPSKSQAPAHGAAHQAQPMQEVGIGDDTSWWSDNQAYAQKVVDLAHSIGDPSQSEVLTAFRNDIPIVQDISSADLAKNIQRTDFVAAATARDNMDYYVDLIPRNADNSIDGIPNTPESIGQFVSQAISYIDAIAQYHNKEFVSLGIEPDAFYGQDPASRQQTATNYYEFVKTVYPLLQAEAASKGIQLTVIGMELALSHDPAGFLNDFAQAEQNDPPPPGDELMDEVAIHPYLNGTVSPKNINSQLRPLITSIVGDKPIIYTEFASQASAANIQTIVNEDQSSIYIADCRGVSVYFYFQEFNDPASQTPGQQPFSSAPFETPDPNQSVFAPIPQQPILNILDKLVPKVLSGNKVKCAPQISSQLSQNTNVSQTNRVKSA